MPVHIFGSFRVIGGAASANHSFIINSKGILYAFGNNTKRVLGISTINETDSLNYPTRLKNIPRLVDIETCKY